jgi:hypothetical protein
MYSCYIIGNDVIIHLLNDVSYVSYQGGKKVWKKDFLPGLLPKFVIE